ncbi:MAG: ABC transporter permease [Bifidobacteriaceae bacterium]|nr:ABC transporter permease [Bifidobacteriaceae bacterium]
MRFVLKRIVAFAVALFVQSIVIFACLRILPGDLAMVIGGTTSTPDQVARIRGQLGLNDPYPLQYLRWLGGVLHGDLGTSQLTGVSVASEIGDRLQITLPLALLSLAVALTIGLPLGVHAVTSRSARVRRTLQVAAIVAGAIPALWGGLLLVMMFGRGVGLIGVLPAQGFPARGWHAFGRALASLALPALSVGVITGAEFMRYTRSALVDVANSDYIAQAMMCGMTRAQAIRRVGLRMVAPQIVSVAGLTFAGMMTGVIVVENLFALPGLATLVMTDLRNRDLLAVQSELLLLTTFFLVMGLVVDVLHHALDPRLKDASEGGGYA